MLPRNLDSSTPVASANLLFSVLPQLDRYTEWEPSLSAIGDVAYACELVFQDENFHDVTYRYTVSLEEPINPSLQTVRVTKAMRIHPVMKAGEKVQFSYKHNLTSACAVFNPQTMSPELLAARVLDCVRVVDHV